MSAPAAAQVQKRQRAGRRGTKFQREVLEHKQQQRRLLVAYDSHCAIGSQTTKSRTTKQEAPLEAQT